MGRKSQYTVVSSVLTTGLILSIVLMVAIWSRPLIQKGTDKSRVDSIKASFDDLDEIIKKVSSKASSTERYNINLGSEDTFRITDIISYETYTSVPVISSVNWFPLNTYELPYERENTKITDWASYAQAKDCVSNSGEKKYYQETFYLNDGTPKVFNVTMYNHSSTGDTNYSYACMTEEKPENANCATDCNYESNSILKQDTIFSFLFMNETQMNILGRDVLRVGTFGQNEQGIQITKAIDAGSKQRVIFRLVYRPLVDQVTGNTKHINITCSGVCLAVGGKHTIEISKVDDITSVGETSTTESIINVEII